MNTPALSSSATGTPLRAVVIDDEPTARRGVKLLLARDPDIVIVGEAGSASEAVLLIEKERPDLAFLDVQMPEGSGFDVLRQAGQAAPPAVIFITAYDEHALTAFEVNAVDYLLKPYEDARFEAAVQRAKKQLRGREVLETRLNRLLQFVETNTGKGSTAVAEAEARSDRVLLKSSGEIFFLKAAEIDWIEAEGDYMKFHVAGKAYLMRETMAHLEVRLDPKQFVRIHRSTIVNIDRVRKLSPAYAGEYAVILSDGTKLKLSRGYQDRLQAVMQSTL